MFSLKAAQLPCTTGIEDGQMARPQLQKRRGFRPRLVWTELPSGGVLTVDRRLTPGIELDLEVVMGGDRARWLWILGNGELLKIVTPAQA